MKYRTIIELAESEGFNPVVFCRFVFKIYKIDNTMFMASSIALALCEGPSEASIAASVTGSKILQSTNITSFVQVCFSV